MTEKLRVEREYSEHMRAVFVNIDANLDGDLSQLTSDQLIYYIRKTRNRIGRTLKNYHSPSEEKGKEEEQEVNP